MSIHVVRAREVKVMNRLYVKNGSHLSSFNFITGIDFELSAILQSLPWYMQINDSDSGSEAHDYIRWQHHILHTFLCVQRIRMYRPFLQGAQNTRARSICIESAESALAVYRDLRSQNPTTFLKSHRFIAQHYQIFSTGITLAVFLLVEQPQNPEKIRADIEMVISDLGTLEERETIVPLAIDGIKVLSKILEMYDNRGAGVVSEPVSLVPAIYTVIGGKSTTEKYLERCKIGYIVNSDSVPSQDSEQNQAHGTENQMPITPASSMDSSLFCGDILHDYSADDFGYDTGIDFELPPDHSFWEQWDF